MHGSGQRVRFSDNDAGRENVLAANPGELPQAGECERLEIGSREAVGLFSVSPFLPLNSPTYIRSALPNSPRSPRRRSPFPDREQQQPAGIVRLKLVLQLTTRPTVRADLNPLRCRR